jgi:exodeoxyribonuclease X
MDGLLTALPVFETATVARSTPRSSDESNPSALYAVIDLETTGVDPEADAIVEVAACLYHRGARIAQFSTLVNPERHIPASASGIHHICDADVVDAPRRAQAIEELLKFVRGASIYVAHQASFESSFLPELQDRPWLCTVRIARHLWPNADNFKNQTLRYHLGIDETALDGAVTHRALADVFVTGEILNVALRELRSLYGQQTLDWLMKYADQPIAMETMPRGGDSTRGKPFSEITFRNLFYWINRTDLDSDLRWNLEQELYIRWPPIDTKAAETESM